MKVLIVDDEEHIREVMRLTLEATGYQFRYPTLDVALEAVLHEPNNEPKNEGD